MFVFLKLRYQLEETSESMMEHATLVFHTNARKLVTQALSYARIQAVNDYQKRHQQQQERGPFRRDSDTYLTEDQYAEVSSNC